MRCAQIVLFLCVAAATVPGGWAFTHPDEYQRLVAFRDKYKTAGPHWEAALSSWTCPTPANNSKGSDCDPCGEGWWGNWEHISCRSTNTLFRDDHVPGDGYVTNVHFSLTGVEGTPPREICDFVHVKEWDFKVCNLEGNLPTYLGGNLSCLPVLEEWDFSRNHMTGPIPESTGTIPRLVRLKMQGNHLTGSMPESMGDLKALEWIRIFDNELEGSFPDSYKNVNGRMTQLAIGGNKFEGTLYNFANVRAQNANLTYLPNMCGMIPVGIQFANGYDLGGSPGLGLPCPEEVAGGWPLPSSA
ncbi:hypothetical protein ACKKBF_B37320 [Auxenochlorella protothecoides x Auxenochlorella symbiontica]